MESESESERERERARHWNIDKNKDVVQSVQFPHPFLGTLKCM